MSGRLPTVGNGDESHASNCAKCMQWAEESRDAAIASRDFSMRSAQKAEASANAALGAQQESGRQAREIADMRRDVTEIRSEMNTGFTEITAMLRAERSTHLSATRVSHEDFSPSDTGSHYIVTRETFETLAEEHDLKKDGNKWRSAWEKARGIVLVVAGGAGIKLAEIFLRWAFLKNK